MFDVAAGLRPAVTFIYACYVVIDQGVPVIRGGGCLSGLSPLQHRACPLLCR